MIVCSIKLLVVSVTNVLMHGKSWLASVMVSLVSNKQRLIFIVIHFFSQIYIRCTNFAKEFYLLNN